MNSEVLNSWKEIAAYMGRGVRTVQRWEQELGLPVRRPRGKDRSAVIALKSDLDAWLHRAPNHASNHAAEFKRRKAVMVERMAILKEQSEILFVQSQVLRKRITYAIQLASQLPHRNGKPLHLSRTEFMSEALEVKVNGKPHPEFPQALPTHE
jgi:hypothetical protein